MESDLEAKFSEIDDELNKIQNRNLDRQELIEAFVQCVNDEPEFPGEPPEEMIEALLNADRETIIFSLKLAVQLTKQGILDRIEERFK